MKLCLSTSCPAPSHLTNPALNLLLLAVANLAPPLYWPALILLELAAVAVEARVYRSMLDWTRSRAWASISLAFASS